MMFHRRSSALFLVALCLTACSGKRHREQPAPSGSNHPPTADAGTDIGGSRWHLVGFADGAETHPYAILKNASRLRLISADGRTVTEFAPADIEHVLSASVPGTFIWVDSDTIHAIEIPSGHERWTRPVLGRRVIMAMDDALAVAADGSAQGSAEAPESLILDINTGRVRYREQTRTSHISGSRPRHEFVFFGDLAVSTIDDATGKARWTTQVPRLDGDVDYFKDSIFVIRSDRTYAELDSRSGRLTEGTCAEAEAAPHACLGTPRGAGDRFSLGKFTLQHGMVAYAALGTWPRSRSLIARSPIGRVRWKTELAPCADARNKHAVPEHAFPSNEAVAVLVTCSESPKDEVLVMGQSDGHVRYRHAFDPVGRLVWVTDRCALVLEGVKPELRCLDLHSGKAVWSTPVFGTTESGATALPLESGDVLLVDSDPLTVSRLAPDGKRIWQADLPGTELSLGRDSDHGVGKLIDKTTRREWSWSQSMGVLAPTRDDDEANISILDLANGKLHEIP